MKRGDVVLVRFPHPSGLRGKKRPAVVVLAERPGGERGLNKATIDDKARRAGGAILAGHRRRIWRPIHDATTAGSPRWGRGEQAC